MSGSGKPPSGFDETIADDTGSAAGAKLDDTLPAPPSQLSPEPPLRSSRSSIPPVPTHRYRHGDELGRGGMGRVVEAYDTQLGRTVALKEVLPRSPGVARRFVREIEITARLEHHGIVPLYDSGTTPDGRPFYVMRRVTGKPLDQVIAAAKDLDARLTLLPAMLAAIDAIAHAHKRGVIHRDLKPTNILVGEHGEVVVIDWGLAKVIDETDDADAGDPLIPAAADSLQTQAGSVFGTPGFMAPEQARGEELTPTTDVYALGATLYQLLAGAPPMTGTSVTEVIGKTLKHEVKPLAQVVDGVPPELIAIVDKAIAFAAQVRYRNAGELADDLRRFLDGRLVAAHSYTRRQRFARFVRRHRAILGVIAIALVAVAAFAWFSVSRVLAERDAARAAREQALVEKQRAEQARDRLAERNDALVVTQARGLLDTNPTLALAMLADLAPTSRHVADARAVAQAASVRGVWWAMEGPAVLTTRVELSADGTQLLQLTRDNIVRVWDLARRTLVIARPYASAVNAMWAPEHRVFVWSADHPPELLDPASNTSRSLGGTPVTDARAAEAGASALVADKTGAALLDLATGARTPLWPGHAIDELELARDGSWLALTDGTSLAAFDATGKELAARSGLRVSRIVMSTTARRLAAITHEEIVELALDPEPVWTPVPLQVPGQRRTIADVVYRGDALEILVFGGEVLGWIGGQLVPRGLQVDTVLGGARVAAGDALIVPTSEAKIALMSSTLKTTLGLPAGVPHARFVARPTTSRIAVVGDGLILVTDLAAVLPRTLPFPLATSMRFVDERTLFTWRNMNELAWGDVAGGPAIPIEHEGAASFLPVDLDLSSGRVLVREESGRGRRLLVATSRSPRLAEVVAGPAPWGTLLGGQGVIFGTGETKPDGRVFARLGDGEPRELVKLDGDIVSTIPLGPLEFAALSSNGELVRGHIGTGAIVRANIAPGESMFLASDLGQRVAIAVDRRLYLWTRDLVEIARFDKPIMRVDLLPDATALVQLADRDMLRVPLVAGATPRRVLAPAQYEYVLDADGKTLVALASSFQLGIVDLASGARWSFPTALAPRPSVALSPRGRTVVQDAFAGLVAWTLPAPDADLAAWIHEQTSARVDGDVLVWPWQQRP